MKLAYITDRRRHLICVPYSLENLHIMAQQLDIKKCWFHKNHYDIPKGRIKEIEAKCQKISPREIVEIIRHPEYAEIIISPGGRGNAVPPDLFWKTQIEYNG